MSAEVKAAIIVGLFLLLVAGGGFAGWKYKSNSDRADTAEKSATQAAAITSNVLNTLSIFSSISQANADAKQQIDRQTDARIVVIEKSLSGDECAKRPVPVATVEQLREHANRIRAGAAGSASGGSAD